MKYRYGGIKLMKGKNRLFILMVAIGIFCYGCTSVGTEENPASEVNEEDIESESPKETEHGRQVSYEEYSGNWTTGGISFNSAVLDGGERMNLVQSYWKQHHRKRLHQKQFLQNQ